jgi:PAS domain S-box-containing protein
VNGFTSDTAIMVFGDDLKIVCWNDGAEKLTGVSASEAVGRPCWQVIAGHDDDGHLTCHTACSRARLVREGRTVPPALIHARTPSGRRRLSFETITAHADEGPLFVHVMHDAPAPAPRERPAPQGPPPRLTPRQREILALLADGNAVKTVAARLGLMETTVRNHVRLLLLALDAHSQLEAVARARSFGLLS